MGETDQPAPIARHQIDFHELGAGRHAIAAVLASGKRQARYRDHLLELAAGNVTTVDIC
jgi:hypothetical protein